MAATGGLAQRVGARVRAHRTSLGLGQDAYARRLGVHRTWVGTVENGKRNLTLASLEQLAEAMGIDAAELLAP